MRSFQLLHWATSSPNQDVKWGAYLGSHAARDQCYGCGSALDTLEDTKVPTDKKELAKYNKRDNLAKQCIEESDHGRFLRRVVLAAAKIVFGESSAAEQGIPPARSAMVTSVSQKSQHAAGFVTQDYWEKNQPSFQFCGIEPDYYYDHNLEWVPGLVATKTSLEIRNIPYLPITVTVKRKALLDEELMGTHGQLRMDHSLSIFKNSVKGVMNAGPSKLAGSHVEVSNWDDYIAKAEESSEIFKKKKEEREMARRVAENLIRGQDMAQDVEPEEVIQISSAVPTSGLPSSFRGPPAGKLVPKAASAATSGPSTRAAAQAPASGGSLSLPPAVAASVTSSQRSAVGRASAAVKSDGSSQVALKTEGGAGCGEIPVAADRPARFAGFVSAPVTTATAQGSSRRRKGSGQPAEGERRAAGENTRAAGTTPRASRGKAAQVENAEVDQARWKDLGINSDGLLEPKHVVASMQGWRGMKSVNAVTDLRLTGLLVLLSLVDSNEGLQHAALVAS